MKNQTRTPTNIYSKLRSALIQIPPGTEFRSNDLAASTGATPTVAHNYIKRLAAHSESVGCLGFRQIYVSSRNQRVNQTFFVRNNGDVPKTQVPKGAVADAVWQAVRDAKLPRTEREIYWKSKKLSVYPLTRGQVHNVVFRWTKAGHLKKLPKGRYLLAPEISERPTAIVPAKYLKPRQTS